MARKRVTFVLMILITLILPLGAEETEEEEYLWAAGLSVISPGLPVAIKVVNQRDDWGWQLEANYFYMLGMCRVDGRRVVKRLGKSYVYGFAGMTANHFNDGLGNSDSVNNTLFADLGGAGELALGRRFSIGLEAGMLIPFYSNQGLDQYDNSGLMVANLFGLFWF